MPGSGRNCRVANKACFRNGKSFSNGLNALKLRLSLGSNLLSNVALRRKARKEKYSMEAFFPNNMNSSGEVRLFGKSNGRIGSTSSLKVEEGARIGMFVVGMVEPNKIIKGRIISRHGDVRRRVAKHGAPLRNTKHGKIPYRGNASSILIHSAELKVPVGILESTEAYKPCKVMRASNKLAVLRWSKHRLNRVSIKNRRPIA